VMRRGVVSEDKREDGRGLRTYRSHLRGLQGSLVAVQAEPSEMK
jgi:hypothetical protein